MTRLFRLTLPFLTGCVIAAAPQTWTPAQIEDFQSDLMIYAPEVGCAPEANIRCQARGLQRGWVWTISTPRFNDAHREALLAKALSKGWTHYAVQVTRCQIEDGYHDLYPVTDCSSATEIIMRSLREVRARGLIPLCTGVAPASPPQPGVDLSLCPVAMPDWDNSGQLWNRLKYLASVFPSSTRLYVELPAGADCPEVSGGDEPISPRTNISAPKNPCTDSGEAWIRAARQRFPNFDGVLHELDGKPTSARENDRHVEAAHAWWRGVQEVLFESDTYWKFWEDRDESAQRAWNDSLMTRYTWLRGCFSGCTTHAPPAR